MHKEALQHLNRQELAAYLARHPRHSREYHAALEEWRQRYNRLCQMSNVGLWGMLTAALLVAILALVR